MLNPRAALCRGTALGILVLLLCGCGSRARAPIVDHSARSPSPTALTYTVLRGDTLYAIAFRYGLDFKGLAAANQISRPFTIFPGQRLFLTEAEPPVASASVNKPRRSVPAATTRSSDSAKPSKPKASTTTITAGKTVNRTPVSGDASVAATPAPVAKATPAPNASVSRWRWPAQGQLSRGFDNNLHKGIDISGGRGDPVIASAAGRVVYAGSGIAGYGLMLIIRHNDTYLSAYGHNQRLLVAEGDHVASGEKIALRGSSGTDTVKLHFEIRRRGRPVDPQQLLPRP